MSRKDDHPMPDRTHRTAPGSGLAIAIGIALFLMAAAVAVLTVIAV